MLSTGTYTGSGNRNIDFRGKAITVTSESGRDATIIDCQNLGSGFIFQNGEGSASVLSGLTIMNGSGVYGGGIRCGSGASPTIMNNILVDNVASYGGGAIVSSAGSPRIMNNIFTGNSAYVGGAIHSWCGWDTLTDNIFCGNTADLDGGAVFFECDDVNTSPLIAFNEFYGNSAGDHGGGILCYISAPVIESNTVIENSAPDGSGIYVHPSGVIEKTIVAFNHLGKGVACSNTTIICCDIFGNEGGDAICGNDGGGNFHLDPLFCAPGSNNLTLAANSPCLPAYNTCNELVGAHGVGCSAILPVPTLSQWGIIILSITLLSFGGMAIRILRRRNADYIG
jgi:hypothetical protein